LGCKFFTSDVLTFQIADQKIWELVDAGKEEISADGLDQIIKEANEEAREIAEREGLEFVDVLKEDDQGSDSFFRRFFGDDYYESSLEDRNNGEMSK